MSSTEKALVNVQRDFSIGSGRVWLGHEFLDRLAKKFNIPIDGESVIVRLECDDDSGSWFIEVEVL